MEITNKKNVNFSKYKDLLNELFKKSFDNKLNFLEKRTTKHLSIISTTKRETNNIRSLVSNMNVQIALQIKKKKKIPIKKFTKDFSIRDSSPKSSIVSKATTFKTPVSSFKNKMKTIEAKSMACSKNKDLTKKNRVPSFTQKAIKPLVKKTSLNLIHNTRKKISDLSIKWNKNNNSFFNKSNDKKGLNLRYSTTNFAKEKRTSIRKNIIALYKYNVTESNMNNRNTITSNKILKSKSKKIDNTYTIKSKSKTRSIMNRTFENKKSKLLKKNSFSSSYTAYKYKKMSKKNESLHKKTKTVTLTSHISKEKDNGKNSQKENNEYHHANKNQIKSMETSLQKDVRLFHHDDSLLIIPVTDVDFQKKGFMSSTISPKGKNIIEFFNGKDERNIQKIFEFLCVEDLIKVKGTSKYFNKNIINYFLKNLNETKKKLENIKNGFINIPEQKNFNNFVFSKGAEKSIELLNEKIITTFFEEVNPPKNEILFVYQIFFQIINNPIKDLYKNKKQFWEKCRFFFLNEGKGKIGILLKDLIIKNKIDVSEDNLYKLYELVKNKLNIILPSYFNRVCRTTVLMTFYIKDILNYLGISNNKENIGQNGYWTYSYIINSIDKKINTLLEYK